MKAEVRPSVPTSEPKELGGRRALALPLIVLDVAAGLAFVWYYAPSLLLLFAGILFAALLDACTRGLARVMPLSRAWRFGLVVLALFAITALAIGWAFVRLPDQATLLLHVINAQLDVLERHLAAFGIDLFGPGGRQDLSHFIADPGRLFGHVQYAVSGAYVVGMNALIIVCLGLFFAAHPVAYREGVLRLLPITARDRVREVMDEMGRMLRSWLLSQLARSVIVARSPAMARRGRSYCIGAKPLHRPINAPEGTPRWRRRSVAGQPREELHAPPHEARCRGSDQGRPPQGGRAVRQFREGPR